MRELAGLIRHSVSWLTMRPEKLKTPIEAVREWYEIKLFKETPDVFRSKLDSLIQPGET